MKLKEEANWVIHADAILEMLVFVVAGMSYGFFHLSCWSYSWPELSNELKSAFPGCLIALSRMGGEN